MSKFIPQKGMYFYYQPKARSKRILVPTPFGMMEGVEVGRSKSENSEQYFFLCTGKDDRTISYENCSEVISHDRYSNLRLLSINDNDFFPVGPEIIKAFGIVENNDEESTFDGEEVVDKFIQQGWSWPISFKSK